MGHGTLVQLLVAMAVQLIFLILQVYAAPFKRAADNYFALCANVALVFVLFSCMVLEQDELVEATSSMLQASMRRRFQIDAGSITAVLLCATLFVFVASLAILLHSLATIRHIPFLRTRLNRTIAEPPPVSLRGWHTLISHTWSTGQDQARVLKERLQVMVPGLRIFLDVDDLDEAGGIGELEAIVTKCSTLLVILSDGYFQSKNCLRELNAALDTDTPLVLVHERDPARGGLSLERLRLQCPEALRERVFAYRVVEWQRIKPFQLVSLRLIGQGLLGEQSLYIANELSEQPIDLPCMLYASPYNAGADALVTELLEGARDPAGRADDRSTAGGFLLLLNDRVFERPELVTEVTAALDEGQPIVMAHDAGVDFADVIARTPLELREHPPVGRSLYNEIAVHLLQGAHRPVSLRLIALKLRGSPQTRSTAASPIVAAARWARHLVRLWSSRYRTRARTTASDATATPALAAASMNAQPLLPRQPMTVADPPTQSVVAGEVRMEGFLAKKGAWTGSWNMRYVKVHAGGFMAIFDDDEAPSPRGEYQLTGATVWRPPLVPIVCFTLTLERGGKKMTFRATTPQECEEWVRQIEAVTGTIRTAQSHGAQPSSLE